MDVRLAKVATPLREAIDSLTTTVSALIDSVAKLEGGHEKLTGRVEEEADNLLAVVRSLGFSPRSNPATDKPDTKDSHKK